MDGARQKKPRRHTLTDVDAACAAWPVEPAGQRPAVPGAVALTSDPRRLIDEHAAFVRRVLRYLGVADADLDDVCQEVFLVVIGKAAGFRRQSSFRTWIYGICWRLAQNHRRVAHRNREVLVDVPPEPAASATDPARAETRRRPRALLEALDDDKRVLIVLAEIEELTIREIAEVLECPLQTAYSRLQAARAELCAAYRARFGEEQP